MKQMLNNRLHMLAAVAAMITYIACMPMANAQSSNNRRVVLDPGTVIPITLNNELSSDGSRQGDTFTANVDTSREAYNNLMNGAVVEGVVRDAVPQEGNNPGTLKIAFTRLRLSDGSSYAINGTPTSLSSSNLTQRSDGVLVSKSKKKVDSLTYAGIGAGAGALVSILSNGKLKIEDILIGGGLGYAAGEYLKGQQKVHDVDLKTGTSLGVLLNNRVYYHRRNTGSYMNNSQMDTQTYHRTPGRKYYSYMGHPYYKDLNTGERVRLD